MSTFVINDETQKNSYGFRVLNSGIDLTRFNTNPVMLDQHWNSTTSVVGKWINLRIEGSKLLGDAEFDSEDPDAAKLKGKVDRGYIKSCSMGISFDRQYMQMPTDDDFLLAKCELYENSIVAIPSNKNSIRLYAGAGELIPDAEIKLSLSALKEAPIINPHTHTMEKPTITLSVPTLMTLGLLAQPDSHEAINAAVAALALKLKTAEDENVRLTTQFKEHATAQATTLVESAFLAGKIKAEMKPALLTMAINDFATASTLVGTMPGTMKLGALVANTAPAEVKTADDFQKLPLEAQLAFKNEHPEEYKKLWA